MYHAQKHASLYKHNMLMQYTCNTHSFWNTKRVCILSKNKKVESHTNHPINLNPQSRRPYINKLGAMKDSAFHAKIIPVTRKLSVMGQPKVASAMGLASRGAVLELSPEEAELEANVTASEQANQEARMMSWLDRARTSE